MNIKLNGFVVALLLIHTQLIYSSTDGGAVDSASKPMLIINLPDEAKVESENITLGQIADVTSDEMLAAKARETGLGRISVPGQKITIERSVILSRLASEMANCRPVFAGAEAVVVSRKATVVKAESFIESAASFLANNVKEQAVAGWEPVRKSADMMLTNQTQDIELKPRLVSRSANGSARITSGGQATVEVSVVAGNQSLGTRQIVFNAKYNTRRAVTVATIGAGEAITPDNTTIETVVSQDPEPAGWTAPYGFVAARNLPAGIVIGRGMARQAKPQVKVERNQSVVIRIDTPGLVVTAMGQAMQPGALGENIKVRNIDSQRIILAKINEDGTVEPVF